MVARGCFVAQQLLWQNMMGSQMSMIISWIKYRYKQEYKGNRERSMKKKKKKQKRLQRK
jgi:hypothetical protein